MDRWLHASTALPRQISPQYALSRLLGWSQDNFQYSAVESNSCLCRESNPDRLAHRNKRYWQTKIKKMKDINHMFVVVMFSCYNCCTFTSTSTRCKELSHSYFWRIVNYSGNHIPSVHIISTNAVMICFFNQYIGGNNCKGWCTHSVTIYVGYSYIPTPCIFFQLKGIL